MYVLTSSRSDEVKLTKFQVRQGDEHKGRADKSDLPRKLKNLSRLFWQ